MKTRSSIRVKPGSIVSGIFDKVISNSIFVNVDVHGRSGTISVEHLADNFLQAALMKRMLVSRKLMETTLKEGKWEYEYKFDELLVLDDKGGTLILSAKNSLIKYAKQNSTDIHPNSVVHGYISKLTKEGCDVRFLGHLSGFAPRNEAADDPNINILRAYCTGQSVRISNIHKEADNVNLCLKQTSCFSKDATFIQDYFLMDEKIGKLHKDSGPYDSILKNVLKIGEALVVTAISVKDSGYVVDLDDFSGLNFNGFITNYQLTRDVQCGYKGKAVILDVSKAARRVDFSLRQEFFNTVETSSSHSKEKKHPREADLALRDKVEAVVEIVKRSYLVLSIPVKNFAIGYAPFFDYNTQRMAQKKFLNGQRVAATIVALPSPKTFGRLLLLLDELNGTSSAKRAKKKSTDDVEA